MYINLVVPIFLELTPCEGDEYLGKDLFEGIEKVCL